MSAPHSQVSGQVVWECESRRILCVNLDHFGDVEFDTSGADNATTLHQLVQNAPVTCVVHVTDGEPQIVSVVADNGPEANIRASGREPFHRVREMFQTMAGDRAEPSTPVSDPAENQTTVSTSSYSSVGFMEISERMEQRAELRARLRNIFARGYEVVEPPRLGFSRRQRLDDLFGDDEEFSIPPPPLSLPPASSFDSDSDDYFNTDNATNPPPRPLPSGVDGGDCEASREGFDEACFVDAVHGELVCAVCWGVLNKPVMTACEHLFCRFCFQQWSQRRATPVCPVDRYRLSRQTDVRRPPRFLTNILNSLRLRCAFVERGCDVVVTVGKVEAHERKCPHRSDG